MAATRESTAGGALVLVTLASGQFLMTLDMSVMNVAIATVAKDVDTTVTGIQTAITLYTLVMAALMITGGKIGTMIGRRKAFMIGGVIYGVGLVRDRNRAEPAGANPGLVVSRRHRRGPDMPAIVALVAANFAVAVAPVRTVWLPLPVPSRSGLDRFWVASRPSTSRGDGCSSARWHLSNT